MNLWRHWPATFGLTGATVGRGNYVYVKGSFLHFCLLASEEIESFHQRQIKTLKRKRYFRLSKEGSRSSGIDQTSWKWLEEEEWKRKYLGASCRHLVFWQIDSKQRWQTFGSQLRIFWMADWTKRKPSLRKFLYKWGFPWNLRWGDVFWDIYL